MPGGAGGHWLWADLTSLGAGPVVPDRFHIEQVRDDRQLAAWFACRKRASGGAGLVLRRLRAAWVRADACSLHYIGYLDATPVTSGTLLDAGGGATIYDVSTPPDFRRRGVGGASRTP